MTKLKSITIKGMHNYDDVTYDLKDFTYLFGHNGAGKSTVLEAIQFALLGYIPNYNKTPAGIFTHCNNDNKMSVTLVLNDGEKDITVVRECVKSGGKAAVNVVVNPQVEIADIIADIESPVFNFNEFIGMTANKLKEWFISFLGNSDSQIKWEEVFTLDSGTDLALQKQMLDNTNGKAVDIDSLKEVNTYLKAMESTEKANIQRVTSTIQNMVHYDDDEAPAIDVDALRAELETLTAQKSYAIQYEERLNHNNLIKTKLGSEAYAGLKDSVEEDDNYYSLIEERLDLNSAFADVSSTIDEKTAEVNKLNGEVKALATILNSDGICPYTQKSCADITTLKQSYEKQYSDIKSKIADLEAEIAKSTETRNELNREITKASSELESIKSRYAERDRLNGSLLPIADAPEFTSTALTAKISEITDKVVKAEANLKYIGMVDNLTKEKLSGENRLNMIKGWIKTTGANGLQSQLTDGSFGVLSENMDTYIKALYGDETLKTKFILEEKANSFSFGLVRNGKYIAFDLLSSGEKCIFTLAMLLCIIANAKSDLKLVLVDDLLDHLDDNKIKTLFKGLNNIKDIQIILAGVKKYTESNYDEVVTTIS